MEVFKKTQFPRAANDDLRFSEDVIILTQDGLLNIGYYSFEDAGWVFHTYTLVDMNEVEFVWMYAPQCLLDARFHR